MFIEFQVGNFRSFRDIQKFSMQAAPLRANDGGLEEENVLQRDSLRILKTKALYGSNASGKSNFAEAFAAFMNMVTFSVSREDVAENIWNDKFQLLKGWDYQPVFFQYTFLLNDVIYRYGFEIFQGKIELEWLYGYDKAEEKKYFVRTPENLSIDEKFFPGAGAYMEIALHDNNEIFRKDSLFLTSAALNGSHLATIIRSEIREILILDSTDENKSLFFAMRALSKGGERKKALENFLQAADTGIDHLELLGNFSELSEYFSETKSSSQNSILEMQKRLFSFHKIYNEEGKQIEMLSVPFFQWESGGTQKLLGIAALIFATLEEGRVLFIDEFDARFHPNLTLKIVELFQTNKTNPKNAQLIFITHDSGLLRKAKLRRDQICFVDKDQYGISSLTTLIEYKGVRKDASYEKEYLQGSYAGVPYLDELDSVITQTLHDNGVSEAR